ncbi:hypothetical protein MMC14_009882 [Varicellaria rhodocarpa]|nr:hypothetical protein [Varicellaria rhodocarpa]
MSTYRQTPELQRGKPNIHRANHFEVRAQEARPIIQFPNPHYSPPPQVPLSSAYPPHLRYSSITSIMPEGADDSSSYIHGRNFPAYKDRTSSAPQQLTTANLALLQSQIRYEDAQLQRTRFLTGTMKLGIVEPSIGDNAVTINKPPALAPTLNPTRNPVPSSYLPVIGRIGQDSKGQYLAGTKDMAYGKVKILPRPQWRCP